MGRGFGKLKVAPFGSRSRKGGTLAGSTLHQAFTDRRQISRLRPPKFDTVIDRLHRDTLPLAILWA